MLALGLLILLSAHAVADNPRFVPSRDVAVSFSAGRGGPVESADLWVSRDGGQTWQAVEVTLIGQNCLHYVAPEDGSYGFYVVLRNAAGVSATPPAAGTRPHAQVMVDTAAPVLQVHTPVEQVRAEPGRPLALSVSLAEENLADDGVRVFYRASGTTSWADGGVARCRPGELIWQVPADAPDRLDLCIVATDLAGNRSVEQLPAVAVVRPRIEGQSGVADSPVAPPAPSITPSDAGHKPDSARSSAVRLEQVIPVGADARRLAYLRRLAEQFRAEGQYGLAVARLEEALRIAPQDAGLLVDLGNALYGSKRYDDADARFKAALELVPEHVPALEGLALVAATQKRYSDARTHLLHLLRLAPDSARNWLRYGDIEHKLGNQAEALQVWERVLGMEAADEAVRSAVRKRLDYFGSRREPPER